MGSCPFIHPFLYGDVNGNTPAVRKMPSSVQVAFLALSSYVGRTTATAELVLDAVDAQAQQLLLQEAATALTYAPSLLEQLARVQALVVYQVIGLFDGNAHTRHLAEERRSTLCNWARQLYDSARQGLAGGSSTALPSAGSSDSSDILDGSMAAMQVLPGSDPARTWHFWILAESIRRIWIVADAVDTIYQAMQYGWRTPASSIACTARHGLWQARSAAEWERVFAPVKSADTITEYQEFM
ncbi:hypothetical protein SCUCBS95973_009064 [Sporothrix curviconia]|uniref:Transcription factor domain-containing protein n=1 Tax=Sporothrix curviconia TaxID=1260050 RepID=A0ABP0CRW5_9PEZI